MELFSIVAAGGNGSGDLVVGLMIGCVLGVLVGPAFRAWQTHREWIDASREVQLVDHLLAGLEADPDPEAIVPTGVEGDRPAGTNGHQRRPVWRASH